MCVQLAVAYFAYLRWAVTVPHGGGYTAPTGPAALPPNGPWPPASIHTLRPGTKRNTFPLVAPLGGEKQKYAQSGKLWLLHILIISSDTLTSFKLKRPILTITYSLLRPIINSRVSRDSSIFI